MVIMFGILLLIYKIISKKEDYYKMSKIVREPSKFTRVKAEPVPVVNSKAETIIVRVPSVKKEITTKPTLRSVVSASPSSRTNVSTKPTRKILTASNISRRKPEPSYFEYLPNDTKYDILSNMTCDQLLDAKRNNPYLSPLITPEYFTNFLNKGYPRQTGRAKVFTFNAKDFADEQTTKIETLFNKLKVIHDVLYYGVYEVRNDSGKIDRIRLPFDKHDTVFKANELTDDDEKLLNSLGFMSKDLNIDSNKYNNIYRDALHYKLADIIINNIKNSNKFRRHVLDSDIVKGDIIAVINDYHKYSYYIFNGCNLFEIDQNKSFPLDGEFQVIKNNVPIKYWFDTGNKDLDEMLTYREEDAYYSVNFDHRPYRGKLIKNLQAVQVDDMYKFATSFQANGQTYTVDIEYFVEEELVQDVINDLVKLFEHQKAYIPFTTTKDENTLFLPEVYEEQETKLFHE